MSSLEHLLGTLTLGTISLLPLSVFAQEPLSDKTLSPVIVTATRISQPVPQTLAHTTVITRDAIELSQTSDVLSLLNQQAGIEIAQNGGLGSTSAVFMRGAESDHVLLLIDGVRVNSVGSGMPLWGHLMLDQVERIEIVRGNVSALYGSEAIGGVVQIFTRATQEGAHVQATLQAGENRTSNASVHASTSLGSEDRKTYASLTASTHEERGFSAIDASRISGANPDLDGYRNQSLALNLLQKIGVHEVGLSALSSQSKLDFYDAYEGSAQLQHERSSLHTVNLHSKLMLSDTWQTQLQLAQARDSSTNTSTAPWSFYTGTTNNRSQQFSWQNIFTLTPAQSLTAGGEYLEQDGVSSSASDVHKRRVKSLMGGYSGKFAEHTLQINARNDQYSDFGSVTTGLIAYGYRFTPQWQASAQLSNAFKAPTFNDLYFPGFGNPSLKPERARSAELGLQYTQNQQSLRAAVFHTETSDLISYDSFSNTNQNIQAARVTGLELAGKTSYLGWNLSANLTLQNPIDVSSDQALLRRAKKKLSVAVAKDFQAWRLGADTQIVGKRFDADIVTGQRVELAHYTVANLTVQYRWSKNIRLGLAVRNVFNEHYEVVDGYNTPGRVALLTLDYTM